MPLVARRRQPPPDPVGKVLAELARPLPHGLVTDDDAACGQHLLDHAQAEREAKVEPNRMADDLGRKAVASIAGANGCRHRVRLPALLPIRKPASSQVDMALLRSGALQLQPGSNAIGPAEESWYGTVCRTGRLAGADLGLCRRRR